MERHSFGSLQLSFAAIRDHHDHVPALLRKGVLSIILALLGISDALATEFSVKRVCDFAVPGYEAVRKICIISGIMDRTSVDFKVETPDGGLYTIEGHREGEELSFLLDGHLAAAHGDCYARMDRNLTICLGETVN